MWWCSGDNSIFSGFCDLDMVKVGIGSFSVNKDYFVLGILIIFINEG